MGRWGRWWEGGTVGKVGYPPMQKSRRTVPEVGRRGRWGRWWEGGKVGKVVGRWDSGEGGGTVGKVVGRWGRWGRWVTPPCRRGEGRYLRAYAPEGICT